MQEMEHKNVHVFDADHPAVLVGADNGPTPVEYVLHALAACLTAGIANIAAARNVNLTEVESTVEGDIDLLGILGLGSGVRNGFQQIKVSFKLEGRRPREAAPGRRAVDALARPCTTSSPTACPWRSRSRPADPANRRPLVRTR